MNRKYIVALSVFMVSTSWGMDRDDIRKQDLLSHFNISEAEKLKAQALCYSNEQVAAFDAVRNHIAKDIAELKEQELLTVEKVSGIIEKRISSGVTQYVNKHNLNSMYRNLYNHLKGIVLDVKDIKSFSIFDNGTVICVEHDSKTDDKFRIFQERDTMDWELLLKAQSNFSMAPGRNASYCDYINYKDKQCKHSISNKSFCISSQGILIAYHVTKEDIAQYLIKNAQALGK